MFVQVFPCPVERPHGRRLKRHRAPQLLEEEEEEDNDKGRDKEEKEKKKKADWKEREESRTCLEEGAENVQHETYVVVSSPETQEELGVCFVHSVLLLLFKKNTLYTDLIKQHASLLRISHASSVTRQTCQLYVFKLRHCRSAIRPLLHT